MEKLLSASVQMTKQIDRKWEFLAASAASQVEQTQKITELIKSFTDASRTLTTTSQNLSSTANNITKSATDFQPTIQALSALAEPMMSIMESTGALTKAVDDPKNAPPPPPQPPNNHLKIPSHHMLTSQIPTHSALLHPKPTMQTYPNISLV